MKKIIVFCLALLTITSMSFTVVNSPPVSAGANLVDDAKCQETGSAKCAPNCPDPASGKPVPAGCPAARDCRSAGTDAASCNVVAKYLNPLINALGILAGVAVTIGIIVGGIQYASSGGDPQKAAEGKKHIKMAVIAFVGFLFMYTFLSFLIPGGLIIK